MRFQDNNYNNVQPRFYCLIVKRPDYLPRTFFLPLTRKKILWGGAMSVHSPLEPQSAVQDHQITNPHFITIAYGINIKIFGDTNACYCQAWFSILQYIFFDKEFSSYVFHNLFLYFLIQSSYICYKCFLHLYDLL